MPKTPKRKSAAVMFTDIAGYTEAMSKSEQKALEMLRRKRKIIRPLIDEHKGVYVKEIGDGTLSYFESGYDASKCAVQLQKGLKDDTELNLRVGIHIGDIVFEDDDVYGEGVNVASRLESMAPVGGVFVSNHVYDELINKEDFECVSLGLQSLKGLGRLIEVYALVDEDLIAPDPKNYQEDQVQVHSDDEVPSVAIIPFRNKGKEEEEFYAYGICSELISDVSSAGLIRVASLEKILELGELSSSEKAERLNVRYTTTGMLWKMGDMFQLSIELYDNKDSKVVWSDQWQENWDSLPNIKANLSAGLLKALNREKSFEDKASEVHTEAYTYYLKAKYKFDNFSNKSDIRVAQGLLEKCISLDNNLLEAKLLMGRTYFSTYNDKKAKEFLYNVIEEGEKNHNYKIVANALMELGHNYVMGRDFQNGIDCFNRSIEFSNKINDKGCIAQSISHLAWVNVYAGIDSHVKAIEMFEKGKLLFEELEDDSALVGSNVDLGYCYLELKGQVDKSLGYFKCANEISKKNNHKNIGLILGDLGIGLYYTFVGNYNKGDYYFKKSIENSIKTEIQGLNLLSSLSYAESLFLQSKFEESLIFFEKAHEIAIERNMILWIGGSIVGIAINKKLLGLKIDRDEVLQEIDKYYQKDNWYNYWYDYLQYLLFDDEKYLEMAHDRLNNISIKLNKKDRAKLLKCPWPKMIIAEWEKHHS